MILSSVKKTALLLTALLGVALTGACGGSSRSGDADTLPSRIAAQIEESVPVYPGWSRTQETRGFSRGTEEAAKYTSDASFDDVSRFYTERLPRDGWQLVAAREVKDRGRIRGERLLQFRRDGYELSIKSAGERADDLGWDYALEVMPEEE